MENTPILSIDNAYSSQQQFFQSGQTKNLKFRIIQLKNLKRLILKYEKEIEEALWLDLHKSKQEVFLTETSIVLQEIDNHIRHLKKWTKPHCVSSPIAIFPSKSKIIHEPLGVALIVAPWNYPFQLLFNPLIGAISAGCCAILKSSPQAENISEVMRTIISKAFPTSYIYFCNGNREVNKHLFEKQFDVIFCTGSADMGKRVMAASAKYLTPVVLELGGKSPCIVNKTADIKIAARRIAWGKTLNCGQTCVAPDYLFLHKEIKEKFIDEYKKAVEKLHGKDLKNAPYYPRIIGHNAMERLISYLEYGKVIYGGEYDLKEKYFSPTLLDEVTPDKPVMQEEIFGPIFPIMTFENINEVMTFVNNNHKPLAFYYFGCKKDAKKVMCSTSAGGTCINDTIVHLANHKLPFGGVGNSGMGKYHGKLSFTAFSNARAVVISHNWIDLPFRYPPFKMFRLVKKML
ncbi:MAG: aldehyde dehydrogenase family protein [Bacteroidales bacterium]|jgi:aldehyde dehydrogenase (NAD+)|nr:aldehyde dehydrogenase family protein [Bacteroidales bacterium]